MKKFIPKKGKETGLPPRFLKLKLLSIYVPFFSFFLIKNHKKNLNLRLLKTHSNLFSSKPGLKSHRLYVLSLVFWPPSVSSHCSTYSLEKLKYCSKRITRKGGKEKGKKRRKKCCPRKSEITYYPYCIYHTKQKVLVHHYNSQKSETKRPLQLLKS